MGETGEKSGGGWLAQLASPQLILSVVGMAATILMVWAVAQERINVLLTRQSAIETTASARNDAQDARWSVDHERIVLLEAKLAEQSKEINRTNGVLDRNSVDREQLVASVIARINNVEANAAAKFSSIELDQRKIGELMATLIERLSNIAGQLEDLNRQLQGRALVPQAQGR